MFYVVDLFFSVRIVGFMFQLKTILRSKHKLHINNYYYYYTIRFVLPFRKCTLFISL